MCGVGGFPQFLDSCSSKEQSRSESGYFGARNPSRSGREGTLPHGVSEVDDRGAGGGQTLCLEYHALEISHIPSFSKPNRLMFGIKEPGGEQHDIVRVR